MTVSRFRTSYKCTSCHPLFVHSSSSYPPVLLCCHSYSQTRLPIFFSALRKRQPCNHRLRLVFFTNAPSSPWSHPHHLAHSGLLDPDSWLWDCPRHSDFDIVSTIAAPSPCSQSCHLTVSIVTLLSASSPCCWLP